MTRMHLFAAAVLVAAAPSLGAQLPNASPAAYGMAGNYTALATGYDAIAWNPAMLSMPGNSSFSFTLAGVNVSSGLKPVELADFAPFSGKLIPDATKEEWLQRIGSGTQTGDARTGITLFALSNGNIGLQAGTTAYGSMAMNQDAAEAILFGNAGRTGQPRDFNFAGSHADGRAFTTGALSLSLPLGIHPEGGAMAIGVTGKYILGNGYARAEDGGSTITTSNVAVKFPTIYSNDWQAGGGAGLDVALAWRAGRMTIGVNAQNVVNTFKWDTSKMVSKVGTTTFDGTTSATNFDTQPYASAPAEMRAALENEKFKPTYGGGVAMKMTESLTLTSDVRVGGTDFIGEPDMHAGVGAQFTGLGMLPLRVGVAKETNALVGSAGFGVRLWHYELAVGGMIRKISGGGQDAGLMVNAFSFH